MPITELLAWFWLGIVASILGYIAIRYSTRYYWLDALYAFGMVFIAFTTVAAIAVVTS